MYQQTIKKPLSWRSSAIKQQLSYSKFWIYTCPVLLKFTIWQYIKVLLHIANTDVYHLCYGHNFFLNFDILDFFFCLHRNFELFNSHLLIIQSYSLLTDYMNKLQTFLIEYNWQCRNLCCLPWKCRPIYLIYKNGGGIQLTFCNRFNSKKTF